jgi:hypothetical protein
MEAFGGSWGFVQAAFQPSARADLALSRIDYASV